jgi:TolA-binding protein
MTWHTNESMSCYELRIMQAVTLANADFAATVRAIGRPEGKESGSEADSAIKALASQVQKLGEQVKEMRMEQQVQRRIVPQEESPEQPQRSGSGADPKMFDHPDGGRGRRRFRTRPNFPRGQAPSRGRGGTQQRSHNNDNWPQQMPPPTEFSPSGGYGRGWSKPPSEV